MIKILLPHNHQNKNESKEHYELKQIAKYILKSKSCNVIGEEINIGKGYYLNQYDQFNKNKLDKSIIDTIGLIVQGGFSPRKEPVFKSIGIEAKVSLADFKNGFYTMCERIYIIAPKGIIPIELLPPKIGLIEVNLKDYKIVYNNKDNKFEFSGINEVVKARSYLDEYFGKNKVKAKDNKKYQQWCKQMLRMIGSRYTIDGLFKKYEINVEFK